MPPGDPRGLDEVKKITAELEKQAELQARIKKLQGEASNKKNRCCD